MLEEYNDLKINNSEKIIFIKRGCFYYCLYRDSYIISYLFNYKVINDRLSFSITNKINVCIKLNELNIGYIIDNDIVYVIVKIITNISSWVMIKLRLII